MSRFIMAAAALLLAGAVLPPAAAVAADPTAPAPAVAETTAAATPSAEFVPGAEAVLVDRIVAIVDEEAILQSDLQREAELYRLERQYAGLPQDQTEAEVRQEVLERLVESKLIIAAAKQADVIVDEEAVGREVDQRIRQLQEHFGGAEGLHRELRGSGMTLSDYRSRLASQLRDQQYLRAVVSRFLRPKIEILENEVAEYYRTHEAEMPAASDSLTLANILVPIQPSAERRVEVQRKVAAALADVQGGLDFPAAARKHGSPPPSGTGPVVKRGELYDPVLEQAVWALSVGEISQPILTRRGVHLVRLDRITDEGRAISQIFFSLEVTEADVAAAKQAAEAARERLRQGDPFARVAAEVSADPASARRGGDLGSFPLSDLSPQFQEALRDRRPGELTEPVATPAGFYIFLVKARSDGRRLGFEEVKDHLRRRLESEKLEAELQRYVTGLRERYHVDLKI